ncbi:MAG: N-acetylmuramate alpha-1-phosphate uridylyltransferase MurU [Betaproteobacteria bacterium]
MKALIFAAGRGERMRPLSDATPKPLLAAGGRRLIEWQLAALARAGVREAVINTAHLPDAFPAALGDGGRYGLRLVYSREGDTAADALETLGGIVHALPLLGEAPFLAVAADIVTDYDYGRLQRIAQDIAAGAADAHLVLVDNPPFHPRGDMALAHGRIARDGARLTYASIGVFAPHLFADLPAVRAKLFPWLYTHAAAGRVSGEHYRGRWANVGTPEELAQLDRKLRAA